MSNLPTEHPHLVPYLVVADARAAIAFYVDALGATEVYRLVGPDGRIGHAELDLGTGRLMLADAYPEYGAHPPDPAAPSAIGLALYVADVDATTTAAAALGATVLSPPADQFYGDRIARLRDTSGHSWTLHTRKELITPAELQRRFDAMT
jgi:uncharacterized glyoxalase superfamily protein PhnB